MNNLSNGKSEIRWRNALELDSQRKVISGSQNDLADAVRRGADLRIATEFRHNEHIDVDSENDEIVQETSEFAVTYLVDDAWVAGVMSLRQPIALPDGFGPRPSMSFFLYNQDGQQAIARPHLDAQSVTGKAGPSQPQAPPRMAKYHALDNWDSQTNAPSGNFIYDFDSYRFYVRDDWQEVLAHDSKGAVSSGSIQDLADAAAGGYQVKVAIQNSCADFDEETELGLDHEVFVQCGPCYFYSTQKILIAGSHPLVRVKARIPMRYESASWDFGWLMLRTDGHVVYRRCDPYSLAFNDVENSHALRWFVR